MKSRYLFAQTTGKPEDVVKLGEEIIEEPKKGEVLLKMLAAAINPADINMIEGTYFAIPKQHYVLGNEGVFEVMKSNEPDLKEGSRVIIPFKPLDHWQGGFRDYVCINKDDLITIPKHVTNNLAAMMTVNPITAWMLLKENIQKGQTLIQNAANSNLGQWINYFAKKRGVNVVNVVRSDQAKVRLEKQGIKDVYCFEKGISKIIKAKHGQTHLAINMVGGEQANECAKTLAPYQKMITVGAMAKEPFSISNGLLIFKNITCTGFNRTRWIDESDPKEVRAHYQNCFDEISDNGPLLLIAKKFGINKYIDAFSLYNQHVGKILFIKNNE